MVFESELHIPGATMVIRGLEVNTENDCRHTLGYLHLKPLILISAMGVLAHSTGPSMALAPSKRGFLNSHQEEINFDDDIQTPPYSEEHPDGLIYISGSSNEGMRDYLEEYCAKYLENLPLSQGKHANVTQEASNTYSTRVWIGGRPRK